MSTPRGFIQGVKPPTATYNGVRKTKGGVTKTSEKGGGEVRQRERNFFQAEPPVFHTDAIMETSPFLMLLPPSTSLQGCEMQS